MAQQMIAKYLKSLEELPGVTVEISGSTNGTIRIIHSKHHALEFLFRWSNDHFIGYFIDGSGVQSQAVISLYVPLQAIQFVSAYIMLNDLRSNQKSG